MMAFPTPELPSPPGTHTFVVGGGVDLQPPRGTSVHLLDREIQALGVVSMRAKIKHHRGPFRGPLYVLADGPFNHAFWRRGGPWWLTRTGWKTNTTANAIKADTNT